MEDFINILVRNTEGGYDFNSFSSRGVRLDCLTERIGTCSKPSTAIYLLVCVKYRKRSYRRGSNPIGFQTSTVFETDKYDVGIIPKLFNVIRRMTMNRSRNRATCRTRCTPLRVFELSAKRNSRARSRVCGLLRRSVLRAFDFGIFVRVEVCSTRRGNG